MRHAVVPSASRGSIDRLLSQRSHWSERRGTIGPGRGTCTPSLERVTPLPIQDGRSDPSEWLQDRLLKVVCFVREGAIGQIVVQHLAPFIQTGPQVRVRGVRLSEQRLSRHRLMSPFNDGMVRRTALAREAHLDAKGK